MGYLRADQINGPKKRLAARLIREGLVKSFNTRTEIFTLQTKNGHDCLFLDEDRLCTIYDRRPHICRRFPLNSARPGFCPHEKIERSE
jgi:Fe-S-cluster containining protein